MTVLAYDLRDPHTYIFCGGYPSQLGIFSYYNAEAAPVLQSRFVEMVSYSELTTPHFAPHNVVIPQC